MGWGWGWRFHSRLAKSKGRHVGGKDPVPWEKGLAEPGALQRAELKKKMPRSEPQATLGSARDVGSTEDTGSTGNVGSTRAVNAAAVVPTGHPKQTGRLAKVTGLTKDVCTLPAAFLIQVQPGHGRQVSQRPGSTECPPRVLAVCPFQ